MSARVSVLALVAALAFAAPAAADVTIAGSLQLTSIGSFSSPTFVASPPADASRVFVVQQGGKIALVRDGVRVGDFLTVPGVNDAGEQGLLSMAFAPDYAASGLFYVYYNAAPCDSTGQNCDVHVDEYRRTDDDHADASSRRTVLTIDHRAHQNHNGGQLEFGPDGMLYAGTGDGGGANDPDNNAQSLGNLLGKILRLDPRGASLAPGDNPFVGQSGARAEIYNFGLRNPWRFSFDHATGDLVVADVGQDNEEEVDFLPGTTGRGVNLGWSRFEGNRLNRSDVALNPAGPYVGPVFSYTHTPGVQAITGGYVVRDERLGTLLGRYVYGDFGIGDLRSLVLAPGSASGDVSTGLRVDSLSSFGEDALCRIYAASLSGPVYRLDTTSPAGAPGCAAAGAAIGSGLPGGPGTGDRLAPRLSGLAMMRRRFRVSRAITAVSAAVRLPGRGSAFRYTLSERARVTFRIYRLLPGRRVGRRCLPATRARRARPRCTRAPLAGTLYRTARAGRRSTPFSGRIGGRALLPGNYRATLRATDAAGNVSAGVAIAFTIVRG
jgi:Glucose / Sorbosone dehydrogenase